MNLPVNTPKSRTNETDKLAKGSICLDITTVNAKESEQLHVLHTPELASQGHTMPISHAFYFIYRYQTTH